MIQMAEKTLYSHDYERLCSTEETVRKSGDTYRIRREIEAMEYVRSRTSIPIPMILDKSISDDDDAESFILMKRIPGQQLQEAWPKMDENARVRATHELHSYIKQLHCLRPPNPGWIGSCSNGPAYDHRLDNISTCGPFVSVSQFHDFLVAPVKNSPRPDWVTKYRNKLLDNHAIIFIHADLSGENILVDPVSGSITGIIDWEMAGFWPQWWEYRKALFVAKPCYQNHAFICYRNRRRYGLRDVLNLTTTKKGELWPQVKVATVNLVNQ
jgi:aminoglycoside phosphotransferase